ncbi:thiosulfate sulfurtransferase GlpE [Denitrificimonas sp. JX-1]|uniref:Thiosulfate sulfurtransferase GlpE n=1 Tax=Denitrificimonas halotolerans TaxID=3098930 RepID=A0ABU5GUF0_9GAMM|nr:thiosulfate sulfurtransferase GlpE [Denitrificimonas sp. JX-1]MDY7219253.1 thiosulfate sulfurtransferase GlpE [Denitrificimonas sp. JX-1]
MEAFKRINVEQAKQLCDEGAVMVDIRDPESFAIAHPTGAIHLDNHSLAQFIAQADLDAPTIVICYHGHSSQSAAAYLHSQDFTKLYSMDGGFEAWQQVFPQLTQRS